MINKIEKAYNKGKDFMRFQFEIEKLKNRYGYDEVSNTRLNAWLEALSLKDESFKQQLSNQKKEIIEKINDLRELHIHPKHPKLDYYDKWESSGCNFCFINRKLKELIKQIEGEKK